MKHSSYRSLLVSALLTLSPLPLFTATPSAAQTLKKRTQLTVVDTQGNKVGRVLGIVGAVFPGASGVLVAFQVTGHPPFVVGVAPTHFSGDVPLVFVSNDCSGLPFMRESTIVLVGADLGGYSWPASEGGSLLPVVAVASPGQTVYIPDPTAPVQSITVGSILSGETCTPISDSSPTEVRPALSLIDLARFFTPPFSLR